MVMVQTYRRAEERDAKALAELAERTFRETFTAQNEPENIDAYVSRVYGEAQQRAEILNPKITTIVVEGASVMSAFVQILHQADALEISRLYVDRPLHGQGVAQELIRLTIELARERGLPRVWLGVWEHNPRAIRFYEKCGFRKTGSHPFLLGNDLQTDLEMTLEV
jgi:ribosomal protein S18 acetylase RimI-like enzyme